MHVLVHQLTLHNSSGGLLYDDFKGIVAVARGRKRTLERQVATVMYVSKKPRA